MTLRMHNLSQLEFDMRIMGKAGYKNSGAKKLEPQIEAVLSGGSEVGGAMWSLPFPCGGAACRVN